MREKMALIRNTVDPVWQAGSWGFPGRSERNLRDLSHLSLVVFVVSAVVASTLAAIWLSTNFGTIEASTFILVAVMFPLLTGLLLKETWQARKLKAQGRYRNAMRSLRGNSPKSGDNTPAGFLIVSPDLRIQFANQKYLDSTLQESEEVVGWNVLETLQADGLAEQANALLARSDPAASCCFNTLIRAGLVGERPVHITMTRIAPRQGEDRVLVVVEDLLPDCFSRMGEPVGGYVC
jgi:PAS domain-containing protein